MFDLPFIWLFVYIYIAVHCIFVDVSTYLKFPPTISRKRNRKYILLHEDYIEGVYAVTATINDAVYSLRLRVIRISYNVP